MTDRGDVVENSVRPSGATSAAGTFIGRLRAPRRSDQMRPLVVFLILIFAVGALGAPLRALLPVYVEAQLDRPASFSSTLIVLLTGGAGAFALLGGTLADRLGQRRALLAGVVWLPLAATIYLVGLVEAMLVLALVAGLASGISSVGGQAYLVAVSPRAALGLGSALYFLGSTLGAALGNLVAGVIAERAGFGTYGLASLLGGLGLLALAIRLLPNARVDDAAPPDRRPRPLQGYRDLIVQRDFLLLAALRFLPTCYWGAATLAMPLLLFRLSGSIALVSIYGAVSLTLAGVCQLLTGRALDRIGRGLPPIVLGALVPLAACGMALTVHDATTIFVAGVAGTMVAWSLSVTFPPLVRDLVAEGARGQALGLLHLLWVVGMVIGTSTAGVLIDVGATTLFMVAAALNLPTPLLGAAIWRRLAQRPAEAA